MKSSVKNPANERMGAIGWVAMVLLLVTCIWLAALFFHQGVDIPEQRCDPRDLAGNPVNLKEAAANGVSVTFKNNCYTQPETK